jgi:hypothetical protein
LALKHPTRNGGENCQHETYFREFLPDGFVAQRNGRTVCGYKAKELIDILGPGGNYILSADKAFLRASDVKMQNVQAVVKCVLDYGQY